MSTIMEFMALLAAHIPYPYESLVYYYGVYSSSHRGKERRENRYNQSIEIQETKGAGRASSTWARLIHRIFEVNPGISLIPPFGIPSSLWSLTSTIPGMPIKKSPEVLPDHYSQKQGVYPYASGKPDKAAQNRKISPMPT